MERREGEGGEVVVAGGQAEEVASGREMEGLVVRHVIAGTLGASSRNRDSTTAGGGGGEEQVIRCERFLPRRSLRVLLVESDDSTRHIVAALLRKCSYQVAAVADGLKAWEVLKEKHYNFDLVLTEVVMPSLSGIGLLSKIMNNEICKSIPVIMMSSHDSIGIVFKCMQEGASDFLVKPVRKNELRNLWQHVWRKYSSNSSGNWYGGGTPNQVRFEAVSDNDAASNHRNANAGNKSKTGNRSDKESDTQSSCSKPETENEIVRKPGESLETENRSFLKETNSILEKHEYNMVTASSMHERGKSKDKSARLEIKVSKTASNKEVWEKNSIYSGSLCRGEWSTSIRNKEGATNNPESLDQTEGTKEPPREIINFIGVETSKQCSSPSPVLGNNDNGKVVLCQPAKSFDARSRMCTCGPFPLRELSLEHVKQQDGGVFREKHVLNHSDASPFSRYAGSRIHVSSSRSGSSSASLCIRTDGSSSVKSHINSSSNDGKSIPFPIIERLISSHQNGHKTLICYYISSSSRNEDGEPSSSVTLREDACVGHSFTENIVFPYPQLGFIPLPVPVGAMPFQNLCAGYNTILQPTFYQETSTLLRESSEMRRQDALHPPNQCVHDNHFTNDFNSDTCHHCVENPHPHRLTHSIKESGDNSKPTYPRIMFPKPTEMADQLGICNHGITDANGSNGSDEDASAAANTGISVESGNEDGFRNCKGKVLERDCSRREAALIRFRLKRKDRCFEKKVRYHSRQKLAEQRPRLKGQFIRQSLAESTAITAEAES